MQGLTVKQAAEELGCSERTIFRMLQDKRLSGKLLALPYQRPVWQINPLSVALLQEVRSEQRD